MSHLLPITPVLLLLLSVTTLAAADHVTESSGSQLSADEAGHPVSFELDIQPILSAYGCNSGPCHGKQRGQNGFQLSLLGFDSDFDHAALSQDARGRRLFPSSPAQSLLLRKAVGSDPHGGGKRFEIDSDAYRTLYRWINEGATRRVEGGFTRESRTGAR